jgi:hypothetical protein
VCAGRRIPNCYGNKKCRKAPNNEERWLCPFYKSCIDKLILLELERGCSPIDILRILRQVINNSDEYGLSDFQILVWIGNVASTNEYCFGRKKVDRAIRESHVNEDPNAVFEKHEICKAFGTYGREGMRRAKSIPIGQTRRGEHEQMCTQSGG